MIDLNATKVDSVKNEERTYGIYPTRNLRIRLLCETLCQTGHKASADDLLSGWESVYGKIEKMVDYLEELPKVVAALIADPYRGKMLNRCKMLTEIISFPTTGAADIQQIA
jgi:hypothetical protein